MIDRTNLWTHIKSSLTSEEGFVSALIGAGVSAAVGGGLAGSLAGAAASGLASSVLGGVMGGGGSAGGGGGGGGGTAQSVITQNLLSQSVSPSALAQQGTYALNKRTSIQSQTDRNKGRTAAFSPVGQADAISKAVGTSPFNLQQFNAQWAQKLTSFYSSDQGDDSGSST